MVSDPDLVTLIVTNLVLGLAVLVPLLWIVIGFVDEWLRHRHSHS